MKIDPQSSYRKQMTHIHLDTSKRVYFQSTNYKGLGGVVGGNTSIVLGSSPNGSLVISTPRPKVPKGWRKLKSRSES